MCFWHHPLFKHEGQIVLRIRRLADGIYFVELDDGLHLAVPEWILNAATCNAIPWKRAFAHAVTATANCLVRSSFVRSRRRRVELALHHTRLARCSEILYVFFKHSAAERC
jgi:hypothetical protein